MTNRKPLWTPSKERVRDSNITAFIRQVNQSYGLEIKSYRELYKWSVENFSDFWASVWDYAKIRSSQRYKTVIEDPNRFPGAKWFQGAKLNFAENLLRNNDGVAFISRNEEGYSSQLTYSELRDRVGKIAYSLREIGVHPGDRVAGYLPNIPETTIAMLGATSIGAIWTCCGIELGPTAVLDRLSQVDPTVLVTAGEYMYKGKSFDIVPTIGKIAQGLPSLRKVAVISRPGRPVTQNVKGSVDFSDLVSSRGRTDLEFEQLPADHPVYIMFTSGTTGQPKCVVQGAAGLLVNQLKELMLHADLRETDRIMYITSPSWMMWNWLVASLALGATVVLYDGSPTHPDWGAMWRIVQEDRLTFLGCSASYINYLRSIGAKPGKTYDLSSLREVSQTASPLSTEGFEWIYREVKADLHFNSISGGTDINGCFAGGVPTLPVYAGELQAPGLGMKVNVYDQDGKPVVDVTGELVCEAPAPSMPLYFWRDPANKKYIEAYFEHFRSKGENVWRHGDYVLLHGDTGGLTFYGRSDSVIKASGVRVGTSEIYNVLDKLPEIADSLAVGQNWKGDQRIILFLKMTQGKHLSKALEEKIRATLRKEASPRHVPDLIFQVPDIPYTFNMKKVETAVANIVNNRPVTNRDALSNPECLDYYKGLLPLLHEN